MSLNQFNEGPRQVITPLGVLDFETTDHRMRLTHVHPGVSVDEVIANTAFELALADSIGVTAMPSAAELSMMRERIDVEGTLRR